MKPVAFHSLISFLSCALSAGCAGSSDPKAGSDSATTAGSTESADFAVFQDPGSDFSTVSVHDVTREVVRFDEALSNMVSAEGVRIDGWTHDGNNLTWERSGVAFQVAFGSEEGERRAYFTETLTGTICDLRIVGPDDLRIFATSEPVPSAE